MPEDGNSYEVVHGELLVTPAPRLWHEEVAARLLESVRAYLRVEPIGLAIGSRSDLSWGLEDVLVSPDLFVVPLDEARKDDWLALRTVLLAAEVVSPYSIRRDRFTKRRLYQEQGVPRYWVVDPGDREVEVWRPDDRFPRLERELLRWHPDGAGPSSYSPSKNSSARFDPMSRLRFAITIVAASLTLGNNHLAPAPAILVGRILVDSSGAPLPGIEVLLKQTSFRTRSDTAGRFVLAGLPQGSGVVLFRGIGWRPVRLQVLLTDRDTARADVRMIRDITQLEPIAVNEEPKRPRGIGVEAFEERRRMGFGKFIDPVELARIPDRHLSDLLGAIPGISVVAPPACTRSRTADCALSRAQRVAISGRSFGKRCFLEVRLDGIVVSEGGDAMRWEDAFDLSELNAGQLMGVEVYRSAGEIPAEFNSTRAACGILVIWTKR